MWLKVINDVNYNSKEVKIMGLFSVGSRLQFVVLLLEIIGADSYV